MSIRYGVELLFEPSATAQVYRLRQTVCGQYGCWAAEMHMLRMTLAPYFQCPDAGLPELERGIAGVAENHKAAGHGTPAAPDLPGPTVSWGDVYHEEASGSVFLAVNDPDGALAALQRAAAEAVGRATGTPLAGDFTPRIALLEYGGLPPGILADAAEYARGAFADAEIAQPFRAWRLVVVRYSSEAAGDDWSDGRWANDVSWNQLYSYPLI